MHGLRQSAQASRTDRPHDLADFRGGARIYFLQQLGLDPAHDLAVCSFYDERQGDAHFDERDVVERVGRHEYDAGAVSGRTIEVLQAEGTLAPDGFQIIWSSPGYSHCCFTAHSDMDPALVQKITQ